MAAARVYLRLIGEGEILLPCAGEVSIDTDIAVTKGESADNICRLADADARKSTVCVEYESKGAALISDLCALRAEGLEVIGRQ